MSPAVTAAGVVNDQVWWYLSRAGGLVATAVKPAAATGRADAEVTVRLRADLPGPVFLYVGRLVGYQGSVRWDATQPDGQPRRALDTSRAREQFGFVASTPFDVGLANTVRWYERNLARGVNYARWIEYSFSASLMIVLIATFAGVTDLRALVAVAGANAAMILFGLLMERTNIGRGTELPHVGGLDPAGVVVGCGPGVTEPAVGTRVAASVTDPCRATEARTLRWTRLSIDQVYRCDWHKIGIGRHESSRPC